MMFITILNSLINFFEDGRFSIKGGSYNGKKSHIMTPVFGRANKEYNAPRNLIKNLMQNYQN